MVALHMARCDNALQSESQENLFLIRWLSTALKQHRFHRDVAPDIEWLLRQGRMLGARAKLRHKLDYLWRSCTGELKNQSDLFRLTYALEKARDMEWIYQIFSDREWNAHCASVPNEYVNAIYLSRTKLESAFCEAGQQVNSLSLQATGNVPGLIALFERCNWNCKRIKDSIIPFYYTLTPGQG